MNSLCDIRAKIYFLLYAVSIFTVLLALCIQCSTAESIVSCGTTEISELCTTTSASNLSVSNEGRNGRFAFTASVKEGSKENDLIPNQCTKGGTASHISYQSALHPANSTHALAVTGLVALGVLLFGVLPTVLYCYCYKHSVENRRRRAVVQFEEHRQMERDMEANEDSRARSSIHDEILYDEEPIEEDLSAVVCHGVDVVLYSDEEGQHTPHPVHFYETAKRFRSRLASNDGAGVSREGQLESVEVREGDVQAEVERLPGLPIEARVRPRRHLPKGKVVLKSQDAQRIEVRFHQDAHIPEADPPPLSPEERARLEAERNRVESPIAYGRANYRPPPNSYANTVGGGSPVLSAVLLNKLASRDNSPVAFSIGNPSPALSLQGSFHSVCRYRGDEVNNARSPRAGGAARGGPPPKSPFSMPLAGSLDIDGYSLPSGDYGQAAGSVGFLSKPHSRAPSRAGAPQRTAGDNLFDSSSDEDRIGLDQDDSDFYDIGITSREHYASLDQREPGSYHRSAGGGDADLLPLPVTVDPYTMLQPFSGTGQSPRALPQSAALIPPDEMKSTRLPAVVSAGSAGNSSSNFPHPHPIPRITSNANNTNSSSSARSSLRASIGAGSPNQKGKGREFGDLIPLDALSAGHSLVHLYGVNAGGSAAVTSAAAAPPSQRPHSSRSYRSAASAGDSTDPSTSSRGPPAASISGGMSPSPIAPTDV